MTVKSTSIKAYVSGNMYREVQRNQIRRYIYESYTPVTRQDLATNLGIKINAVCGRVNELVKAGEVEVGGIVECPVTGNMVESLKPPPLWKATKPEPKKVQKTLEGWP